MIKKVTQMMFGTESAHRIMRNTATVYVEYSKKKSLAKMKIEADEFMSHITNKKYTAYYVKERNILCFFIDDFSDSRRDEVIFLLQTIFKDVSVVNLFDVESH